MPCRSCEKRRKMIKEAQERDGKVKGVVKVAPKVAMTFIKRRRK